jgi:hypothetical protein
MALEINEIGIRMRVTEGSGEPEERQPKANGIDEPQLNQEALVEECVRRVLQALRSMKER